MKINHLKSTEIISLLINMNFHVAYDQWDIDGRNWIRFHPNLADSSSHTDAFNLTVNRHEPLEDALRNASNIIFMLGQQDKIKQIKPLTGLYPMF